MLAKREHTNGTYYVLEWVRQRLLLLIASLIY